MFALAPHHRKVAVAGLYYADWPMDEGGGTTIADASGNGHAGTLDAGASWDQGENPADHAVRFNGAENGKISVVTVPVNAFPFQITCKAYVHNTGDPYGIIFLTQAPNGLPGIYSHEFGIVEVVGELWAIEQAYDKQARAAAPYSGDGWRVLEARFISNTHREIWIDGQLGGTNNESPSPPADPATMNGIIMGRRTGNDLIQRFTERIEWARIGPIGV